MSNQGRVRLFTAVVVACVTLDGSGVFGQAGATDPNAYPNPYGAAARSPLTMPAGRQMGWVMGLDVDRNGRDIWLFDTCGGGLQACMTSKTVDPVLRFDPSGKLLSSFGAGMFVHPHGLYVDPEGNIWIVDGYGGNVPDTPQGHQVFKFSPEGKLLLTLGTAGVKGNGPNAFNTPSDVVVGRNGDIFVADGHGGDMNDRIVKFSKDGKFIKAWGTKGKGPGQFDNTHSLAIDSQGRLFVGDRTNLRIQIFDQEGKFLEEWKQFGAPSEIFIDRNDTIYVADSISNPKSNPGWKRGIRIGSARDGRVTAFVPEESEPNQNQELVVVDANGSLWGGFTSGAMVHKYPRK